MKCAYCELKDLKRNVLFEDDNIVVAMKDTGITEGQVTVFPKEHLTIFEMVKDDLLNHCVKIANKVGISVFEALGVQGTNVIIQNGLGAGQKIPHFALEIIPRRKDDGLQLLWNPQAASEEEIETTALLLKEELKNLKEIVAEKKESVVKKSDSDEKIVDKADSTAVAESHLLKSLRKIP